MSSVNNETKQEELKQQESSVSMFSKGPKVVGYVVPWWAILAVVLLLAYLVYDYMQKHSGQGVSGDANVLPVPAPAGFPPGLPEGRTLESAAETPKLKNLFGRRYY